MTAKDRRRRIEPRGLSREEAADYIGVGVTLFDEMVEDKRMPKPKIINSRAVWDVRKLDSAFDALPDKDGNRDSNQWLRVV